MTRELISQVLRRGVVPGRVAVAGWLRTARHGKDRSFLSMNDGSCFDSLQVVAEPALENYEDIRRLTTGASVVVIGEMASSPGRGQSVELRAAEVVLVGNVRDDYPLQKKRHSLEFLRSIAHLRMRTNTFGAVMRVRNAASREVHRFFQDRGFMHLHAPIITGSDCEGAGQMFRVSVLDAGEPPRTETGKADFSRDFFGREASLTVSGQLEAEIAVHAFRNVYTFGPTFRAENSNTRRHLAEFWMVEPEMAFCDLTCDMKVAEEFLKSLCTRILDDCRDDVRFFAERFEAELPERLAKLVEEPFEHLTYTEAIDILTRCGERFDYEPTWGTDLQSEHERFLTERHVRRPVIVTDYPRAIKPFYMYLNDDERTVRAMDVLVPGVGEIIGGSQREDRADILRARMSEQGLREDEYWWYVELREYGSVPHAGFGLGFDRAVQFMTGMNNIRDVVPFPRVPGGIEF